MTSPESVVGTGSRSGGLQDALLGVATALNKGVDRQGVLERIAVELRGLVPHTELMIARADPEQRVVTPVFAQGEHAEQKLALRIPYGYGLTGRVAETGEPAVYNHSASDDPGVRPAPMQPGGSSDDEYMLVVPLQGPEGVEGILTLYRQGPGQDRWQADDLHVVKLFATQAQVAFHNAELYAAAEEHAMRLQAMNEILRSTSAGLDVGLETICASWQNALRDLIPFTITGIAIEKTPGRCEVIWLSDGIDYQVGLPLPTDTGPFWTIRTGQGYILDDIRVYSPYGPHAGLEHGNIASVVTAPLKARGRTYGVIGLGHPDVAKYDEHTRKLLEEVGVYLAAALDNTLLYKEVVERKKLQSTLLAELISKREEDRKALATELHDDTIQLMAAATIQVERIGSADPAKHPELIRKARTTLQAAMDRARGLMVNLRPPVLDSEGLVPALRQQLELLAQEDGISVGLDAELEERPEPIAETVLFRSLQEALRNVRKHARAGSVQVELRTDPPGWIVGTVVDDGVGFEAGSVLKRAINSGHIGLHSMREQVEMAGGSVDVEASPGNGTRLTVSVPSEIGVAE